MIESIAGMTWRELRDAAAAGAMVLLPTGSTEQHGPHLPVTTDTLLVEAVARAALEKLSLRVLLAPTFAVGASDHHRPFFALSLHEETYVDAVFELVESIAEAGFRKLFIVNGHGGNTAPLRLVLSRVKRREIPIVVATADYWSLAAPALRLIRSSKPGGAAHAGEIETSLMMHLAGDLVRTDRIESHVPSMPEGFTIDLIDGGAVVTSTPWTGLSAAGQIGEAEAATGEAGKAFFDAAAEALAQTLVAFGGYDS